MGRSQHLRPRETRALMKLQGDLATVVPLSEDWKNIALDGTLRMIPAKFVVYGVFSGFRPDATIGLKDAAVRGSLSDEANQVMGDWFQRPDMPRTNPFLMALMDTAKQCFTHRREELVDDREWFRSEIVNGAYAVCEVQDNLTSMYRHTGADLACGFSLHRHPSDRPFGARDRTVLHLLTLALKTTYRRCAPIVRQPLRPRLQETLRYLLAGDSEKQIARRMGLSQHTIHDYVKGLYREFDVSSRAELMTCCLDPVRRADSFETR